MRVCLSSLELFGLGVYGGFGRAVRFIGRELVRRGISVTVVVPRRTRHGPPEYELDGMRVLEFEPRRPWTAAHRFREADADIYHAQEASLGDAIGFAATPDRRHIVTFRDPMDAPDWSIERETRGQGGLFKWHLYRAYVANPLVRRAISQADARFCAAPSLIPKVTAKYGLREAPTFLPTPVHVPVAVEKAPHPTVCAVGRWHRRKRIDRILALAAEYSDATFILVGGGADPDLDASLRSQAKRLRNVEICGVIDQFRSDALTAILSKSWILVNASLREGLPTSFVEAAAARCAILSCVDSDNFASRFGCAVGSGPLRAGLDWLLTDDRWRACGERAHAYVRNLFGTDAAMTAHLDAYARVLSRAS